MITIPLTLLVAHFVGDFILQSDWMAINKSKRWDALSLHVFVYSMCFAWLGLPFVAATVVTHFWTDAITSRITARLWFLPTVKASGAASYVLKSLGGEDKPIYEVWVNNKRHWFFAMIGLDQLIHFTTLAFSYKLLVP